ncbi:MAG: DUF4434 domain-containing protein [Bacteroidales bacterium]|nr:DUF4434 domain-containing protein [Bacteroidales bacterium]
MVRFILLLVSSLLAVTLKAADVDLTLIPPSRVSDKVDLDVRAGLVNCSDKDTDYHVRITVRKGLKALILADTVATVRSGAGSLLKYTLPTAGMEGHYTVTLKVRKGLRMYREKRQVEVVPSERRSLGTIDGAWIGLYHWSEIEGKHWNGDIRNLTEDDWRGVVRSMHKVGMDIIVIQELFRNQLYVGRHDVTADTFDGRSFYPSDLYPERMEIACPDPLEAIMDEADRLGMNVLPGIGLFAWFDFSTESLEWHKRVTKEVFDRYGHHSSFYGFYVSEESHGSLDNWEATEQLRQQRREEIVSFFAEYRRFCDGFAPSKPVMLATNSMQVAGAEETYSRLLKNLDILCPFGFARMPENDLTGREAAALLQKWCDAAGSHLWFDLEAFLFNPDTSLYPRDFEGIMNDLRMFDNFEKILCYQYPGVFNNPEEHPLVGDPRSIDLYNSYREYLTRPARSLDLTLVPPVSATDKTDVDIRAGITNDSQRSVTCNVKLFLRSFTGCERLVKQRVRLDMGETCVLEHLLRTEGLVGKYEVVLKVRRGFRTETVTRPIEILPSEIRSPETLDAVWLGTAWLPDYSEADWRGVMRSMHHLNMNVVLVPEEFRRMYDGSRSGCKVSDPMSVMMDEADKLDMYVVQEVGGDDLFRATEEIYARYGTHKSFYGFCIADDADVSGSFMSRYLTQCRELAPSKVVFLSVSGDAVPKTDASPDVVICSDPDMEISGPRLWYLIDAQDIDSIKNALFAHKDVEKAVYGRYLGVMDNTCYHPLVGNQESDGGYVKDESNFGRSREMSERKSLDLYVSYSAYSMYRDWMKPYSVPPGVKLVKNPKGVLKVDVDRSDYVEICLDQHDDPRTQERHWQAVPSIAAEADGSVIYEFWNAGGRDEEMGNYVTLAISEDLGRTWERDVLVIYPKYPRKSRIFDPVIWRGADGKIHLKYSITVSDYGIQIDPLTSSHEMIVSWNGERIEYTEPEFITYGLMINPPTEAGGRELYPIYRCTMNHLNRMVYKENPERGTFAYVRKGKRGFRKFGTIPPTDYHLYDFDEHQFVCLDDKGKELMCVSRFRGGPRKSFSHDYGRTWSEFEPMPEVLPATSSRLCIMRLASGRLMLMYNNDEERRNMTVALSDDNGATWPHKLIIDPRNETSYPAACQLDDGSIVMAYDRSRYKDMDIFYLRFTEDDILSSTLPEIHRITD